MTRRLIQQVIDNRIRPTLSHGYCVLPQAARPAWGHANRIGGQAQHGSVSPIVHKVLRSSGQPPGRATPEPTGWRFNHNFSQMPVHTTVPMTIQPKLIIGRPEDKYEQEADRVAEQVMRMPNPSLQRQVEPEEEEGEEKTIKAKLTGGGAPQHAPGLSTQVRLFEGRGYPLTQSVRNFFEPRFGCDFSQVRVHTDARAVKSAQMVNARAYTIGQDIVFRSDQYMPGTPSGRELLAHELTHVVQQNLEYRHLSPVPHETPQVVSRISAADGSRIARWSVSGNTATVNKRSDRLWNLAKSITGHGRDWPCIWPTHMRSPRAWDDPYERFLRIGDTFDISNLNRTTGPSATFTFALADDNLQTMQILFGGNAPVDLEQEIANLAHNGETPIQNLTLCGHTSGDTIWGDSASLSLTGLDPEQPVPAGAGAHNKMGPHRCWFTRNASVRIVGCTSTTVAAAFAEAFLRKGSQAIGTNHWLCWWHQTAPTDDRFASVEGPPCNWPPTAPRLRTAAEVNHAAGLWVTTGGRL